MRGVRCTLEPLALLAMGLGSLWFAVWGSYERLMNPSFRAVTIGGAALLVLMGAALLRHPRRAAGWSALAMFLVLFAAVAVGRPFAQGDVAVAFGADRPATVEREGYEPLRPQTLFAGINEEALGVAEGKYALTGIVYRNAALDAEGVFVLLEPLMACCLADALALGVRVKPSGPLPEPQTWQHVYGTLRTLAKPVTTPRFRFGAVMFTNVSRRHLVEADDVVSLRSLMADVVQQVPEERCSIFREALESTGLADELRKEGPFTLFVPLDLAFEALPRGERDALFSPAGRARLKTLLESFVVRGQYFEADLHRTHELTTLSGRTLALRSVHGQLRIEGARMLFGDTVARNGIVHIVHPAWVGR